jgi:hypothetical protein
MKKGKKYTAEFNSKKVTIYVRKNGTCVDCSNYVTLYDSKKLKNIKEVE